MYLQKLGQQPKEDLLWTLIFQLQTVGVPLTVLILAAMGIRSYPEIIIHFLLLSAAVNSLWLQNELQGHAQYMAKLLTVSLPLASIYMTQGQLSGWEYITAFMASVSLGPLIVMPVLLDSVVPVDKLDTFHMRLTSLCSSGALLSTIVNPALL